MSWVWAWEVKMDVASVRSERGLRDIVAGKIERSAWYGKRVKAWRCRYLYELLQHGVRSILCSDYYHLAH